MDVLYAVGIVVILILLLWYIMAKIDQYHWNESIRETKEMMEQERKRWTR